MVNRSSNESSTTAVAPGRIAKASPGPHRCVGENQSTTRPCNGPSRRRFVTWRTLCTTERGWPWSELLDTNLSTNDLILHESSPLPVLQFFSDSAATFSTKAAHPPFPPVASWDETVERRKKTRAGRYLTVRRELRRVLDPGLRLEVNSPQSVTHHSSPSSARASRWSDHTADRCTDSR